MQVRPDVYLSLFEQSIFANVISMHKNTSSRFLEARLPLNIRYNFPLNNIVPKLISRVCLG